MKFIEGKIKKIYHTKIVMFYLKDKLGDKYEKFLWALTTGRILSDGLICQILNTKLSDVVNAAYFALKNDFNYVINNSLLKKADKIYRLLLNEKYLN